MPRWYWSPDATDMRTLQAALRTIDPTGEVATPVARVLQPAFDA